MEIHVLEPYFLYDQEFQNLRPCLGAQLWQTAVLKKHNYFQDNSIKVVYANIAEMQIQHASPMEYSYAVPDLFTLIEIQIRRKYQIPYLKG